MIALIVLGILSIVAIVATVIAVARDGYGPVRTDWSRLPDHRDSPATPTTGVPGTRVAAPAPEAPHIASPERDATPAAPVQGTRVAVPATETPHVASLEHAGSTASA
ncbi:hypothetical protein [Microbacterium sp. Clip185]|uniref:hypothetical protein n=1 Tax=Microbacterium sp. Clip185 TaxID=3025663 RepID=UPI002365E103|nr:hypothetical protein [Microbacterium sp. Clip185]WDG18295.1 hypothetical protein PQV94_00830 [Microbacterium sp. Clip185]